MPFLRLIACILFATLLPAIASASEASQEHRLGIVTVSGTHEFSVEVMRSRDELEKGLMFRRQMGADSGMLFDFGTPQAVSMWMKNTYLPLDMVFVGRDGRVVSVKEGAVPMSEEVISSGGLVTGVIEINAGTAKRIGVRPGDRVLHPMFGP